VDGDGVKRPPANYDQLPKAVPFRGKTSKGNPVPQKGVWNLDSYRASVTSIIGEPLNATKEMIVEALMSVATSHPYSGHKKKSKSSKVGSPWGHSDAIYVASCCERGCEKQFQVRRYPGILAVYTFKVHGGSGHTTNDSRRTISRSKAKGTTRPLSSINNTRRVPYAQHSASRDVRGDNANVAYVKNLSRPISSSKANGTTRPPSSIDNSRGSPVQESAPRDIRGDNANVVYVNNLSRSISNDTTSNCHVKCRYKANATKAPRTVSSYWRRLFE
jgi:hypothetical protein